jgi:hypothetical protein
MTGRHALRSASDIPFVTDPLPHRGPALRIVAVVIMTAIAFVSIIAIAAAGGDTQIAGKPVRTADPRGYLHKVETYMKQRVPDDYQQRLIAAGRDLCEMGIDGTDLGQGRRARQILTGHHVGTTYENSWPFLSGAADQYLC